jgi:hypothetical protein
MQPRPQPVAPHLPDQPAEPAPCNVPPTFKADARGASRRLSGAGARKGAAAALAAAIVLGGAAGTQPAAAVTLPTLSVNDGDAIGAVGDSRLSLDEAIRLTNGTLEPSQLSAAERARITGSPGAASADLIKLDVVGNIAVPTGKSVSALIGNTGDTLDGKGSVLSPALVNAGTGLTVQSSNFTVRDFTAQNFSVDMRIEFGGLELNNINLQRVTLLTGGVSELQVGASSSNGSLTGLSITDSTFQGQDGGGTVNVLMFAAQPSVPAIVDNVKLEDVVFSRNKVVGGGQGLTVGGAFSFPGASTMTRAVLRNIRITDNQMTGQLDAPLNVDGAIAAVASHADQSGVDGALVQGNYVEASNYGMWTGNEAIGLNAAPSRATNNFVRNVTFQSNTVVGGLRSGRGWCMTVENAADFAGDLANNNQIQNVKILDNDFSKCVSTVPEETGYGIKVSAGRASVFTELPLGVHLPGPSTATNNTISDITIRGNSIDNATEGIVLEGGFAAHPSTATGNRLAGVSVTSNKIADAPAGIRVLGGKGPAASIIARNSVDSVTMTSNTVLRSIIPCEVLANDGPGAFDNTANAACRR